MYFFRRIFLIFSLLIFLAGVHTSSYGSQYFLGQIEFEINGETIKHQRVWKCEKVIAFRPANQDLFTQIYIQKPTPEQGSIVKKFGAEHGLVFDNWTGCGVERRRAGEWTQVSVIDSIVLPKYGEYLFLKKGEPSTIQNPFQSIFKVRLIKEGVTEIDLKQYELNLSKTGHEGADLLYLLTQSAAYAFHVDMITWNDTDKIGLRQGLPFNNGVWEVDKLQAPLRKNYAAGPEVQAVSNYSFIPLPLGYLRPDGKRGAPDSVSVKYADKQITLNDRGFAEILLPETGIKRVLFTANLSHNVWAIRCVSVPEPSCPNYQLRSAK